MSEFAASNATQIDSVTSGIAPPRRRGFLAALAAGATVMPLAVTGAALAAPGEATDADAELIALCDRFVAKRAEIEALCLTRHTIEEERRTSAQMERLYGESRDFFNSIPETPSTAAGARALARASLACAQREADGELVWRGQAEWLAFGAAEFLAREDVA